MASEQEERLLNELSLLESMYEGQVSFDVRSREVTYASHQATCKLRLPAGYLVEELPEVIIATTRANTDLRSALQRAIVDECMAGEEGLDSIVDAFNRLVEASTPAEANQRATGEAGEHAEDDSDAKATVIVWLHHLLNTNKRKQALSPQSSRVAGVTKPGYPGVLVYSGPAQAVRDHVDELKQLQWQAFQVRLEIDDEWPFAHGKGVAEVESMKDVVAEIGDRRKEEFMKAMRMK